MRIHVLQHAWFEGLGIIQDWIKENGSHVNYTKIYEDDRLPDINTFDLLIILGGPMSISETDKYPWLLKEKIFIKNAIDHNKRIVGICLGAQFLAEALGANVYKGPHKEIGWYPIQFDKERLNDLHMPFVPETLTVFHWHGETFDIPEGAISIASTEAFPNQGFIYNNQVLALQFHLEVTRASVMKMVNHCRRDITVAKWVQSEEVITTEFDNPRENMVLMRKLLNFIATSEVQVAS